MKPQNLEVIKNLNPYEVLKYFAEISSIPRGSGNTDKIVDYLVNFAIKNNLKYVADDFNNVIIIKETNNKTKSNIALQAHIDMVCVKTDDYNKDMQKEGIDFVLDGEWLKANKTSLGADDGIGMAMMLAILSDSVDYNRYVVGIFTNDEEIGLIGAHNIDLFNFKIKNLINIDNEEFGVFNVGCAGGTQVEYKKSYKQIKCSNMNKLTMEVEGLLGGHSGMEITKNRGNAIKIIIDALHRLYDQIPFYLISVDGGTFNNAIPNRATAKIAIDENIDDKKIIKTLNRIIAEEYVEYENREPNFNMSFNFGIDNGIINAFDRDSTKNIINAIYDLPDGLISTFEGNPNIAETSLNLGILNTNNNEISITYLIRSNVNEKKEKLNHEVFNIATSYGFEKQYEDSYPAWEYKKSELEDFCKNLFKEKYGSDPIIEVTHGGLECGILLQKMPDVNVIAIGPTVKGAHTVEEKVDTSTIAKIYEFIVEILNKID